VSLLPNRLAIGYARLEPFGFPILLMLIFIPPHVLGVVMMPMVHGFDRPDRSDLPAIAAHVRRTGGLRNAPHGRDAPGTLPRRTQDWVKLQSEYPCLYFVRRLARAHDAL